MPLDYTTKSYGRNAEVKAHYQSFENDHDVAMPGPRRLGKTFVLDRLVEASTQRGWHALKIDVAGCDSAQKVFREFCDQIGRHLKGGQLLILWLAQRFAQLWSPRSDGSGPWYQDLLSLDQELWFGRLLAGMNQDPTHRWVLLIDELPIFLKALHDRGPEGVAQARDFMNLLSRWREAHPRVRWLITGSIGIEPLAKAGNYMGVLAKFQPFELEPLTESQAIDLIQDLAREGRLPHRSIITQVEAQALVAEVGWRAAYYLEALAQKLAGEPTHDQAVAARLVAEAVERLLHPAQMSTFGTWEEHLRKHYPEPDRTLAFKILAVLSKRPGPIPLNAILASLNHPEMDRAKLQPLLTRLHVEGFISASGFEDDTLTCMFRNPLLRRWWLRYPPHPTA
ncbi:MAG: hypothetical protein IT580_01685 [Verrucomicrobiales bacterium]|nr:hypothetical protein [Verrucomicrobiales bacterium]